MALFFIWVFLEKNSCKRAFLLYYLEWHFIFLFQILMTTKESSFSVRGGSLALLGAVVLLFSGCMSPKVIEPDAKVSFHYVARDPATMEVMTEGDQQEFVFDFTGAALYQLLAGATKDDERSGMLKDPLVAYNADLVQKQTTLVLREMGIEVATGEVVDLGGVAGMITDVVNEDGVEQVVLDSNPLETLIPLEWSFTITEIK